MAAAHVLTTVALAAALLIETAPAAAAEATPPTPLPVDAALTVNGIDLACTGIGQAARDDPRWKIYGTRIETSDSHTEYLAGADFTLQDLQGRDLLSVHCDAPWLLLRLPAGRYSIKAVAHGIATHRGASFSSPEKGQQRIVLQFPDA